ncbi:hypothetical protein PEBR_17348 [Penicillium brasilianum]|uniref:Uncharacterized protein n=1 Tax=Penicillium brasilianum TaxID=104259 RepID=A0A1S9RPG7_PENBI|nr:hypothetical protein PEBR_17348 [Penicillium brasilianum]
MKLLFPTTILLATFATAKYTPGQDCRTNKGCDNNYSGSKWSVVIESGDARMIYDPSMVDSTRYIDARCTGVNLPETVDKKRKTIYDKIKGKLCDGIYFLTTSAIKEDEFTSQFKKTCAEQQDSQGGSYYAIVRMYPTKELAVKNTGGKYDASVFP